MRASRVFWLCAHKVLKFTELHDLRAMGFEVFNPPYISAVYDQSVDRRLDWDQPTTLPQAIFEQLMGYNFFFNKINSEIFDILNEYFDVLIVTLSPHWLKAVLPGYRGRLIYRVYGQHTPLSDTLIQMGMWRSVVERENFSIIPFSRESVEKEHRWFTDLCHYVVPYQIPNDVFARTNTWAHTKHREEIATSIPNIQNEYFANAYARFNAAYPQRIFRIYGPQRTAPADSRLVGSLQRDTLLDQFTASSGFFYNYQDEVCYLPPIEMMQIGGPVIYAPDSLLSRMYDGATPGLVRDRNEAEKKFRMLLKGDSGFIGEVVAAQDVVRRRYDRAFVQPAFETAFRDMLTNAAPSERVKSFAPSGSTAIKRPWPTIAILLHVDGLFTHQRGKVHAFEGIPRVVDSIVTALVRFGSSNLLVTCTTSAEPALHDFFHRYIQTGQLRLLPIECGSDRHPVDGYTNRLLAIDDINSDPTIISTFIPHYYLFPEALLLKCPTILYLPDYFPHLMPDVVFDESVEKDAENRRVGVAIAEKSTAILTASHFTASYLSDAGFVAPASKKIRVVTLPLLGAERVGELEPAVARKLHTLIAGRRYLFYPTANRPNKQLTFFMRLLAVMRLQEPDLILVTTCSLGSVPTVAEAYRRYELEGSVLSMPRLDEASLRWLYQNSAALCLTSTLEGNFPPQIREALEYGAPVVATRLSLIQEAVGDAAESLLLCNPLDLEDFQAKLTIALHDRSRVVAAQEVALQTLRSSGSLEKFYDVLASIVDPLAEQSRGMPSIREVA